MANPLASKPKLVIVNQQITPPPTQSNIRASEQSMLALAKPYSKTQELQIKTSLQQLQNAELASERLVPRVPAILPLLLKNLRDENVSAHVLVNTIVKDVALVAEVLHEANSPFYSPANKLTNLDSALLVLGQNGLRMVVAKAAFRPLLQAQTGRLTKPVAPLLWEESEICAHQAAKFAKQLGLDPFAATLAAMLLNVGMIVILRMLDRRTLDYPESPQLQQELNTQGFHLAARIGRHWDFPDEVILAVEEQAQPALALTSSALGIVLNQARNR